MPDFQSISTRIRKYGEKGKRIIPRTDLRVELGKFRQKFTFGGRR
jgi:hypothetical protein